MTHLASHRAPSPTSTKGLCEEALRNFEVLLASLDFRYELELLGISPWRFLLGSRIKKECEAQVVGLWRLALERSFPEDWQDILERFIAEKRKAIGGGDGADAYEKRVREHIALFENRREDDFTVPAAHLVALCGIQKPKDAVPRLKIVLHLRDLYDLVFDRLI